MNICILSGYIVGFSESCGISVDEETENRIKEKMENRPKTELGGQWMLNSTSLEWEFVELPLVEPEPPTEEQSLTRYANELTGADDPDLVSATETLINQRMEDK